MSKKQRDKQQPQELPQLPQKLRSASPSPSRQSGNLDLDLQKSHDRQPDKYQQAQQNKYEQAQWKKYEQVQRDKYEQAQKDKYKQADQVRLRFVEQRPIVDNAGAVAPPNSPSELLVSQQLPLRRQDHQYSPPLRCEATKQQSPRRHPQRHNSRSTSPASPAMPHLDVHGIHQQETHHRHEPPLLQQQQQYEQARGPRFDRYLKQSRSTKSHSRSPSRPSEQSNDQTEDRQQERRDQDQRDKERVQEQMKNCSAHDEQARRQDRHYQDQRGKMGVLEQSTNHGIHQEQALQSESHSQVHLERARQLERRWQDHEDKGNQQPETPLSPVFSLLRFTRAAPYTRSHSRSPERDRTPDPSRSPLQHDRSDWRGDAPYRSLNRHQIQQRQYWRPTVDHHQQQARFASYGYGLDLPLSGTLRHDPLAPGPYQTLSQHPTCFHPQTMKQPQPQPQPAHLDQQQQPQVQAQWSAYHNFSTVQQQPGFHHQATSYYPPSTKYPIYAYQYPYQYYRQDPGHYPSAIPLGQQ